MFGDNHIIQPGVDPALFCREARFFRAVTQAKLNHAGPIITTDAALVDQENRKAAKTIVEAAAAGNAYADVTHIGIGPDEVDALNSIAHNWLLQRMPVEKAISQIETLIEVMQENKDELDIEDLPNVLPDEN